VAAGGDDDTSGFAAFPVIEAPVTVDPAQRFEVAVGVDGEGLRHTVSEGIELADLDPHIQTVQLKVLLTGPSQFVVEATELPVLKVTRGTLDHDAVVFRLWSAGRPPETYDPEIGVWTARITATFYHEELIVGEGYREIRVNESPARRHARMSDATLVMSEGPPPEAAAPATESAPISGGRFSRLGRLFRGSGRAAHRQPSPMPEAVQDEALEREALLQEAVDILAEEQQEPPVSFARLDAPASVVVGEEFDLVFGLAPKPSRGVAEADPVRLPPGTPSRYELAVHVVAFGFALGEGEVWRHKLLVDWDEQPFPSASIHLTAGDLPFGEEAAGRVIKATFGIDGNTVAVATRAVAVVGTVDIQPPKLPDHRFSDVAIPTSDIAPDLTVHLFEEGDRLWMTLGSPWPIDLPREEVEIRIGSRPDEFVRHLVDKMNAAEGQEEMWDVLRGIGSDIGKALRGRRQRNEFWETLAATIATVGRDPQRESDAATVLILSDEPYVPWELAIEPLDAEDTPFLAQRVAVGRWPLDTTVLPPPHEKAIGPVAVVAGDYEGIATWGQLPLAIEEADELGVRYAAQRIAATYGAVKGAISGRPLTDVLHMALHGQYDQSDAADGLILVDLDRGEPKVLTATAIKGIPMQGRPFVFLNACQVGNGREVLGLYGGIAAAFIDRGACGVIAPLWNVRDDIAKEVALTFYEDAFGGISAGEAVRRNRQQFKEDAQTSTFMAYQYFGHPALRLVKG